MDKKNYSIHKNSINKAIDYIENHIDEKLELETLAKVSNLSKFHFLRIFKETLNETPFQFVVRLRIEKAASLLLSKPEKNISEIAFGLGFTDMTVFAKNFKTEFAMSATDWRKSMKSNFNKGNSNKELLQSACSMYICKKTGNIKFKSNMSQNKFIEIKEVKKFTVAYIRHFGSYISTKETHEAIWTKLFSWAAKKGITTQVNPLVIYHDDPSVTIPEKQRMSFCISIPENIKTDENICKMEVGGGKYLTAGFELLQEDFILAWDRLMNWIPTSNFETDYNLCFEMYGEQTQNGLHDLNIYIPIK